MNAAGIEKTLRWVAGVLNGIGAYVILPVLALVIAVDVAMRYFVNRPIFGAAEASEFLLLLFFTFGMSYTLHTDKHIRMDLVFHALPRAGRMVIELLTLACGLIFFGAIAYQSIADISYSQLISERSDELHLLIWPFYATMLVVFSFLCLQLFVLTALRIFAPQVVERHTDSETWID
ncbi:MAG: TRAP transporter small permease [Rhodobiaceae bacterium]|nr:TRAP transporter small permease [Rhodobiaceae bacterium]MCC0055616.1 TRAP transporter small permease [Rhodobiaceae bacterium]